MSRIDNEEMMKITNRISTLIAYDTHIRDIIGDEDVTEIWLSEGLPDGFDYDDLVDIASDDKTYNDIIACAEYCVKLS